MKLSAIHLNLILEKWMQRSPRNLLLLLKGRLAWKSKLPFRFHVQIRFNSDNWHLSPDGKHALDLYIYLYEGRTTEKEKFTVQCSFRKDPSLQQLLTFKKPANSKGVFKCLSGCTLCKTLHDLKLKSGKILKANARFECTSRNLVYAMICNGCGELYIGETGDTLRNRFACHRSQMALDTKHLSRQTHM